MTITYLQNVFSNGVLDEKLQSRPDYEGYYKALRIGENIVSTPQGGVTARFGTSFLFDLSYVGNLIYTTPGYFNYDPFAKYFFIIYPGFMDIYLYDTIQAHIVTPWDQELSNAIRFTQVDQALLLTSGQVQPQVLTRTVQSTTPIVAYNAIANTLTASFIQQVGAIYPVNFTGITLPQTTPQVNSVDPYFIKLITANTFQIYGSADDAFNEVNVYQITAGQPPISATVDKQTAFTLTSVNFRNKPPYDFGKDYDNITFTISNPNDDRVTIDSSIAFWTTEYIGGYFQGQGGLVYIDTFLSSTEVEGQLLNLFIDTSDTITLDGNLCFIGVPVFSDIRGWPEFCIFFQGRVWFGATPALPSNLWASITNDYFNFEFSNVTDIGPITLLPPTPNGIFIQSMIAANAIIVLTSTAVCTTQLFGNDSITPTNAAYNEQVQGAISAVEPVVIDNQIIYTSAGGNIVRSLTYDIQSNKFESRMVSAESASLINSIVDMAVYENTRTTNGEQLILVNGDGTMAIYQSLKYENIKSWTHADTQGLFKFVVGTHDHCYFIVERVVNGVTKNYLEFITNNVNMDCCTQFKNITPFTSISVPTLASFEVGIVDVANNRVYKRTVEDDGTLTLGMPSTNVVIGLIYVPTVQPLSFAAQLEIGNDLYRPKHVRKVYVDYYQSIGINVQSSSNNYIIPLYQPQDNPNDGPIPHTGVFEINVLMGWNPNTAITISQPLPYPFYLRGIGFDLDVDQL